MVTLGKLSPFGHHLGANHNIILPLPEGVKIFLVGKL